MQSQDSWRKNAQIHIPKGKSIKIPLILQKLQNPVLFTEKSRINRQALPVHRGTISVMLNVQKKDAESQAPNFKGNISKKARFKIKWKTIQWLMDYKKGKRDLIS